MPDAALATLLHIQTEHQLGNMAIKTTHVELTLPMKLPKSSSR